MSPSNELRIYRHCIQYIYIKWKSQQLISELLDSTYRGSPKSADLYLEIVLLDCLITKKIPGFFQDFFKISAKFQDFPGLSMTGGNHIICKWNFSRILSNLYEKLYLKLSPCGCFDIFTPLCIREKKFNGSFNFYCTDMISASAIKTFISNF